MGRKLPPESAVSSVICRAIALAAGLERWVYFLVESPNREAADLLRLLPESPFTKATEILEMIARSPELRLIYDDRAKEAKDRFSEVKDARAEGKIEGKLVGQIQTLQEILGENLTSESKLSEKSVAELERLVSVLREQIGNRI